LIGVKAYLRGVLAVTLAVMLAHYLVVATVRSPLPAEYWLREFQIAKRHQALAMASPKLILVGGSCTLFGIDAAAVQKALNVPTINFGLHAGMRLEDHLDNAREVARPGDTILLSLEPAYYDFYSQSWDTWQLRNALAWNRPSLERLSPASRVGVYLTASDTGISTDLLWGLVQSWTYSPAVLPRLRALAPDPDVMARYEREKGSSPFFAYDLSDLDANGDLLHATDTQHSFQGTPFAVERPASISTYARDNLRPFLEEMKDRQVRVLFDYTPYVVDQPPAADWPAAEAQFRAQLAEIGGSLIERRDAFFYPTALFFNSNLHLNEKGRDLRTATLIEALKPYAQDWQRSP
jgi:hypothetical protein